MSTHAASREPMRRYVRDSNRRKVVFDLNAPPTEDSLLEGAAAVPVNPPQGLQAASGDGVFGSPIDVEAIEDEVQMLSSSNGFPQERIQPRRRRPATVVIDEELEIRAGRSRIFIENLMTAVSFNSNNKRERTPANTTIIDCEVYSTFKDDYNAKRKKVMNPPCSPPPKEPTFTCPVCMSELVESCSTICGHIFCQGCIKLSIQKMKKCPTCRRPLTMKSFHRVYLPASN